MRFIWNIVRKTNLETANKARLFLLINTLCCAGIGLLVWVAVHNVVMGTLSGALIFTLCPAFFIGIMGGIWYLYKYNI